MSTGPDPLADEALIHAWVDGPLSPRDRERVDALLAADPDALGKARAWAAQRESLRGLHAALLEEAPPPGLIASARRLPRPASRDRWHRWGGIAAGVALAFTTGWFAHAQWGGTGWDDALPGRPLADFGRQALLAHVVFSPEVRHPVEVTAAQQEHLVQWLSKRLGRPIKVPDLAAQGFELVGGRLLPGGRGARAQFMYQDARGQRITLYLGALDEAGTAASAETAFRFTQRDGASSFYWVDQGFGYALAGPLGRAELLPLAETVHRQL